MLALRITSQSSPFSFAYFFQRLAVAKLTPHWIAASSRNMVLNT